MKEFNFKGAGKTRVILDGNFLRIKRKGFLNFANHGMDGEKTIDIYNMSGVQMKEAGSVTSGYLQFIFMGSKENKGGLFAATKDENTIMFIKKEQDMANEIKAYIENIIANKNSSTGPQVQTGSADEIRKFKELLDEGIITEEEFAAKKKELLGL
nr:SHOCT domain-containing protein [Heyndrickxia oleronia]